MSADACELKRCPASILRPTILQHRDFSSIEIWTGENEADYRENPVTLPDGTVAWRVFEFDGWGNVLGG